MSSAAVPHVVLVPVPAQGHINPFTSLAHFFVAAGISVTLVHSTRTHSLLSSSAAGGKAKDAKIQGTIRIEVMPDLLSSADGKLDFSLDNLAASIPTMSNGLEEILEKLMQEDNAPCCLIADGLLPWCHDVALKFTLPWLLLWTGPASSFSLGFHIPELRARGYIPALDQVSLKKTVDFIPGLAPICVADMPRSVRAGEGLQSPAHKFMSSAFKHLESADRVLVNTFYELESDILEALRTERALCIDPVGPLFMMSPMCASLTGSTHQSLLQEDNSCLAWLNQQRQSSVLYISFGSVAAVEEDVFEELAHGLEASGESFLWVIRPDAHKDKTMTPEQLLPEGFMERSADRGRVISWAPQLAVLGHSSVGAFLTHCGWNSVLESLSNGIPLLGFPQLAEQDTNLKFIVHDWGVGLPLLETGACKVKRTHVQRAVNAIMKGGEGTEARAHALEWRDTAHRAPHGASKRNLERLVDDLRKGHLKPVTSISSSSDCDKT